ncbi:prolyl aminopeptidase [Methylomonas methanica]|uniref:Proline iminopeptidase n=1 Tax=Methylomonas methanica (strain DSM 25384 / MC09) TaxID=857087 RepID=G0A518_METMM|nr:prolyl aminopeptidase [Methylomonas methanica]AEF99181.1 proline iminopeptidase [Methylomonas methanica MC09]
MKRLYSEISPFHVFWLDTGGVHQIYVEQSGNPAGIPVVFLHGGPCSGTKPDHRRFFDPERYHIILLDQRGCGQSLPFGELAGNTTQDLIDDMERIRIRLRIEQWLLFGGSWGGTLALLYAQQFPARVSGMVLRGVFLARQADMRWFLQDGVNRIYPQRWQDMLDALGENGADGQVMVKLCEAVFGGDQAQAERAALHWQLWSGQVALGLAFDGVGLQVDKRAVEQVRMELHYARNHYFIAENQILQNCVLLQDIPTIIIHGQNDLTCPLEAGWRLHQALPRADYLVLPNAGHIAKGEEMIDALVDATDKMAALLS